MLSHKRRQNSTPGSDDGQPEAKVPKIDPKIVREGQPTPSANSESCTVCQQIAKLARSRSKRKGIREVALGTWEDLLDRQQCRCCQMIANFMKKQARYSSCLFEPSCSLVFEDDGSNFTILADKWASCHVTYNVDDHPTLSLIPSSTLRPKSLHFIDVDKKYIDLRCISEWVSSCQEEHQDRCRNLPSWQSLPLPVSMTLIDIEQECLVETTGQVTRRYVTLSYVWGKPKDQLMLGKDNFPRLSLPGALMQQENRSKIPRTILDAISLLQSLDQELGVRYLWVDMLCIQQDNPEHTNEQIAQMASIYANSYFTIIEAGGQDAYHGLRGVSKDSPRESWNPQLFEFSEDVSMIAMPVFKHTLKSSVWNSRGWTFQEGLLSPRQLVFIDNSVYWTCKAASRCENLAAGASNARPRWSAMHRHFRVSPWPELSDYFGLVQEFNSRKLTHAKDAQNAFSAITTMMGSSFHSGFLVGIPEFFFDIGLLWSGTSPLQRREQFPSWSWLGWSGNTDWSFTWSRAWLPLSESHSQELSAFGHVQIYVQPCVDWHKADKDGSSPTLIDNSYHRYVTWGSNSTETLPSGWTVFDQDRDGQFFRHTRDMGLIFNHPFPVPTSAPDPSASLASSLLYFNSESCFLALGKAYPRVLPLEFLINRDQTLPRCLNIDLYDDDGRWAGVLESDVGSDSEYVRGSLCELVAISEVVVRRRFEDNGGDGKHGPDLNFQPFKEMERVADLKDLEWYMCFNVLWIEWVDGIAYRRAVGRVWKEAWEQQIRNKVHIVLG